MAEHKVKKVVTDLESRQNVYQLSMIASVIRSPVAGKTIDRRLRERRLSSEHKLYRLLFICAHPQENLQK